MQIAFDTLLTDDGWELMSPDQQDVPTYYWHEGGTIKDTPIDFKATFEGNMFVTTKPIDVPAFNRNPLKVVPNFVVPRHFHNLDEMIVVFKGEYTIDYGEGDEAGTQVVGPGQFFISRARDAVHDDGRAGGRHVHRDVARPRRRAHDDVARRGLGAPLMPLTDDDLDVGALRRLLDREAIIECIVRTTRGPDRYDWELFGSAYHSDAEEDHGSFVGGFDGVKEFIANAMTNFDGHQRYVSNFSIDIAGDEAHCESYYLIVLRMPDAGKVMMNGGRYLDRLERRDKAWRIATRAVVSEWNTFLDASNFASSDGAGGFLPSCRDRQDPSYDRPLQVTRPRTTS